MTVMHTLIKRSAWRVLGGVLLALLLTSGIATTASATSTKAGKGVVMTTNTRVYTGDSMLRRGPRGPKEVSRHGSRDVDPMQIGIVQVWCPPGYSASQGSIEVRQLGGSGPHEAIFNGPIHKVVGRHELSGWGVAMRNSSHGLPLHFTVFVLCERR